MLETRLGQQEMWRNTQVLKIFIYAERYIKKRNRRLAPQAMIKAYSSLLTADRDPSHASGLASSQHEEERVPTTILPNSGFLCGPKGMCEKFALTWRGLATKLVSFLFNFFLRIF